MNWKKILRSTMCLVVVLAILLNCVPVKADAVAVTGTLAIGIAACLILMSAGVIFNPQTVEDIEAIGQSFQTHLTDWGVSNGKQAEVLDWLQTIVIVNPFGAPDGEDDEEDDWAAQRIRLSRGLLGGISSWIAGILLMNIPIFDSDVPATVSGWTGFVGTTVKYDDYMSYPASFPAFDFLELSYRTDSVLPLLLNKNYIFGFYWDEYGVLYKGKFINPYGAAHASYYTLIPFDSLTLESSICTNFCYSVDSVKSDPNYMTSSYYAIAWDKHQNDSLVFVNETISCYQKKKYRFCFLKYFVFF